MTDYRRTICTLSLICFLIVVLSACASQPERLWLKSPGWSRAKLIGNTRVSDSVPVTFDSDGNLYLFFIRPDDQVLHLRIIALDNRTQVLWDRTYTGIELTRPSMPRIAWSKGVLQLFWIDSDSLFTARAANTGEIINSPIPLSDDVKVDHYDIAINSKGEIAIWFAGSRDEPGLYTLPVNDINGASILVDDRGIHPDLTFDHADKLHVTWARYPPGAGDKPLLYATYPNGVFQPGQAANVAMPRIVGTSSLQGPKIGLDSQNAYIFWSLIYFSGELAGTAETHYVHLPLSQPSSASSDTLLSVPYSYDLPYQPFPESPLKAGSRIPIGPGPPGGSSYVTEVETNSSAEGELVVTLQSWMGYLMHKTKSQVTAAFFQNGEPTSYQILSFSPSSSTLPAVFSDDEHQLYVTWLEKGELPGWAIYLSSTAPKIKDVLDKLTSDDIARVTADVTFGFLTGALMIPIGLAWILPSVLVLALLTRVFRVRENQVSVGSIVSSILAMIVLWIVKLGVLPGMLDYVPFSAWIPILSEWLILPLRIGVPLLAATFSLLVAWYLLKRRAESSIYTFFIIYAAVDAVLTLGVYGVLVFAAI